VGQKLAVLRAIDKLDKFGPEGVALLLGEGRKDESGDFTKGAGLDKNAITVLYGIHRLLNYKWKKPFSIARYKDYLRMWARISSITPTMEQGLDELEAIRKLIRNAGYETDQIRIDPGVVRGLEYYTGPVYECELLFDVTNEKGETVQFGSVAGGGRYDGLVERFTGQTVPATGFSIGVSRLMTALKNLGKLDTQSVQAPVVVCVMDRDADSLGRYQRMVQKLRNAKTSRHPNGIRAELYQGNPKQFGKQLQYADRRGCAVAVIQGGDERAAGQVQLKDLIAGREAAKDIADRAAWVEQRPAQVTVLEIDLIAEVEKILAQYED
jgi:histidyl-tRNA synthetase